MPRAPTVTPTFYGRMGKCHVAFQHVAFQLSLPPLFEPVQLMLVLGLGLGRRGRRTQGLRLKALKVALCRDAPPSACNMWDNIQLRGQITPGQPEQKLKSTVARF